MRGRAAPPQAGPVRPFRVPEAAERRLANGLALRVVPRSGFPLATAVLAMKTGEAAASPDKAGLPSLCAEALEGGTASLSAAGLARSFESIGAGLAAAASWDATTATVTCLAEHLPRAMELLAEAIRRPAFPDDEFDRCKERRLAAVRQRAMSPATLASDVHARLVFGARALYGRPLGGTAESVAGLEPADARMFAGASYGPDQAALVVAGDVAADEATALAERCWGDWSRAGGAAAEPGGGPATADRRIRVVHRPGAVQSEIRTGHVGVRRSARDYVPLQALNLILGGSFSSRLNLNLRERRGFTYGVRSSFAARRQPGPFCVSTAVGTASTGPALAEIVREVEQLAATGPTLEEVETAASYLAGVFPNRFQTLGQMAAAVARLFVYDLPAGHYRTYRDRVRSVTLEDVATAGRARLHPGGLQTVVVGDADAVVPALEAAGAGPVAVDEDSADPSGP